MNLINSEASACRTVGTDLILAPSRRFWTRDKQMTHSVVVVFDSTNTKPKRVTVGEPPQQVAREPCWRRESQRLALPWALRSSYGHPASAIALFSMCQCTRRRRKLAGISAPLQPSVWGLGRAHGPSQPRRSLGGERGVSHLVYNNACEVGSVAWLPALPALGLRLHISTVDAPRPLLVPPTSRAD
jgi:hypothetical protein